MSAYIVTLLSIVGINVILAVSLNMIAGFCGQFSLGHAAFYGAGAYAAAMFATAGLGLPLALLAAAVVAGLLGVLVGFASLRLHEDLLAVTTIGINFLFVGFVRKQAWLGGELGISNIPASGLGPGGKTAAILICALLVIAFSLYVGRSWAGLSFRAVGDDEQTARTIGINVNLYKLTVFGLGTAIAGFAGGLYAYFIQFITPDSFGFTLSVTIMAMVVIGGAGSTLAVAVAAVALTLAPEAFRFVSEFRLLIFGGLLVVVMRFAPRGLAGAIRNVARRARQ